MGRRILISVVTRNRPLMLQDLFRSLELMVLPTSANIEFLICENNDRPTLGSAVSIIQQRISSHQINYVVEKEIGIAAARNRCLRYAIDMGFDLLAFVDDDEYVDPNWIIALLKERDLWDLDIVGSPVRPMPAEEPLTFTQGLVWSGLRSKSLRAEQNAVRQYLTGKPNTVQIATGSWLGKVAFFDRTRLLFDTRLRHSGGEDWDLWRRAVEAKAVTGWAKNAIVYETVPVARMTFSYHFRRNRDHNATMLRHAMRQNPIKTKLRIPAKLAGRSIKLFAVILCIPLNPAKGLLSVATAAGGLVGLISVLWGSASEHYEKTTGY